MEKLSYLRTAVRIPTGAAHLPNMGGAGRFSSSFSGRSDCDARTSERERTVANQERPPRVWKQNLLLSAAYDSGRTDGRFSILASSSVDRTVRVLSIY